MDAVFERTRTHPPMMPCSTSFKSLHWMRDTNTSTRSVIATLTPLLLPLPPFSSRTVAAAAALAAASFSFTRESFVFGSDAADAGPSCLEGTALASTLSAAAGSCACGCADRSLPLASAAGLFSGMVTRSGLAAIPLLLLVVVAGACWRSGVAERENIPPTALVIEEIIPFLSGVGSRDSEGLVSAPFFGEPNPMDANIVLFKIFSKF